MQQVSRPKNESKKLFVVETKEEVFVYERKLDAIYKHIEYKFGQAKLKEVSSESFQTNKRIWVS